MKRILDEGCWANKEHQDQRTYPFFKKPVCHFGDFMKMRCLIVCVAILCGIGCEKKSHKDCLSADDIVLYAPISEKEMNKLVVAGMTRETLYLKCGEPYAIRENNKVEYLIYPLVFDGVRLESPNEWVMAQFTVVLSNEHVLSWMPSGTRRVY